MIGISKLYCDVVEPSDALRYGRDSSRLPSHLLQFSKDKRPVVVWNVTQRCNLKCVHCYAHAKTAAGDNELSTKEGMELIDDLAQFGSPVMLFSGGEPLVRKDLPQLAEYAVKKGMRAVISTNGTLITRDKARALKAIGLSYVGISLDGMEQINDRFRGVKGAYSSAIEGIENCKAADIKVGLRFTINKFNSEEIPKIFDLLEERNIPRACFYHLVYAGRGSTLVEEDSTHEEKILSYVEEHGSINNPECRELLSSDLRHASYLLKKLTEYGLLRSDGTGRWTRYHLPFPSVHSDAT